MAKRTPELKRVAKRYAQLKKTRIRATKYPLRGKSLTYRDPFKSAEMNAWEVASDEALENFEKRLEVL